MEMELGACTYSTVKNPVRTYSKAGKYTVSLTVKNANSSNNKTIAEYIVVAITIFKSDKMIKGQG